MSKTLIILSILKDENGTEISTKTIKEMKIETPEKLEDLGLTQKDQLEVLSSVQENILHAQTNGILTLNNNICPECGSHLNKNGHQKSIYSGVYADSRVLMSKLDCSSPTCKWNHNPTIKSYFGGNISPELAKLQSELGATLSFRKASNQMKLMCARKRPVNNHMRIREAVYNTGEALSRYHHSRTEKQHNIERLEKINHLQNKAKELVVSPDGAYVHDKKNPGHNFEVMVAKVYNPENISKVSKNRYQITQKQCVGSAMKDKQAVMKTKILEAAKLEGLDKETTVIGLADGAANCWNVIYSLLPYCTLLICILDWFHVAKAFIVITKQLPEHAKQYLKTAHTVLWYGEAILAINCLLQLRLNLKDTAHIEKLDVLITYIRNNQKYIVNYDDRAQKDLPFSSQMAESTVEHFVAERFKKRQKMAWTRNYAHNVLQVRGALVGGTFDEYWRDTHNVAILEAA